MKKAMWVILWACAILVLSLGAQAGSISGRVTGPWGVFPLEGILVESYNWTAQADGPSTTTAANGTYVLGDLAAGTWRVRFRTYDDIYIPEVYDNYLGVGFSMGTNIEVQAVGTVSNINATLYFTPTITGRVTRLDGTTPLANVRVAIHHYGAIALPSCVTDTNGNYTSMSFLPGDTYTVAFSDMAGIYMPEVYNDIPGTDYQNYGSEILLVANHSTNVSASLSLPSTIAGTVTGPDGATPMPGVRVTAYREIGTNWIGMASSLTDAAGGYEVGPLAAGTHRVGFDDRTLNYIDEFFDNAPDLALGTDVAVPEGAVVTIDASLVDVRDSVISGTVTGGILFSPLAGIVVETSNVVAEMSGSWTTTGANGTYSVGVAAGTYRVRFRDTNGVYIGEVYDNVVGDDFSLGANVSVSAFKIATVNASLDVFSTISGMVNGPDGTTRLAGIVVESTSVTTGAAGPSTVTAANGLYTIRGLLAGLYRVRFRDEGGLYIGEVYNNVFGDDFGKGVNINVITGMGEVGINATLEQRPVVTSVLPQETVGHYQILSAGPANMSYLLQEASSLTSGWADVGTFLPAPSGTGVWSRTTSATQTFWRVQMLLPD